MTRLTLKYVKPSKKHKRMIKRLAKKMRPALEGKVII